MIIKREQMMSALFAFAARRPREEYGIIRNMKNEREKNNRTELLYETDGMLTEFDAVVINASKEEATGRDYVELDRTAFFPEGGGQGADTGMLETADKEKIRVTDVQTINGYVRHYVEKEIPEGTSVKGLVDKDQRFSRMQNHGAEHLVCGLIHSTYGYDNVGFHLSDDELVIDINGPLSKDQLADIEERANRIVFENVPVTISFPTEEEAALTDFRSKIEDLSNIRLVTIEGYDVCACCAPHVSSTGQFGSIKILSFMPHRGGTRITMTAGMDAYKDHVMLHDDNAKIMEILSSKRDETAKSVSDHNDRFLALKEENTCLRRELSKLVSQQVVSKLKEKAAWETYPETFFTDALDPVGLRNLVNEAVKVYDGPICAFLGNDKDGYRYIFGVRKDKAEEAQLRKFADDFNNKCCAKGGGSDIMIQGTSNASKKDIEEYFSKKAEKA